jgi:glutathione S-transferase
MQFNLYYSPGTCSLVPLIALEEIGAPFETSLLKFAIGEHKSAEYLQVNPKGKVPTLVVDGRPLTENIAIASFLVRSFPEARLLPIGSNAWSDAESFVDLSWCASTVHPIVTRIVLPQLFCDLPAGIERVWTLAVEAMRANFELIDRRLENRLWILGDWSIVDAYLFWIWGQAAAGGFDGSGYRHYASHAVRMGTRPAVQRALHREAQAHAWLEKGGFAMKLPPPPASLA